MTVAHPRPYSSSVGDALLHVRSRIVRLTPGQSVYLAGDLAETIFSLEAGMLRVMRTTPDGGAVAVRHVLDGDVFGEEALLGVARTGTAEALTPSDVRVLDPATIAEDALAEILRSLSAQTVRLMDYGYHLQAGDLRSRAARYLAWLVDTPLGERVAGDRVAVHVTHEPIAEATGSTRESISKIVTELCGGGLIESGYRTIELVDLPGPELAAEGL